IQWNVDVVDRVGDQSARLHETIHVLCRGTLGAARCIHNSVAISEEKIQVGTDFITRICCVKDGPKPLDEQVVSDSGVIFTSQRDLLGQIIYNSDFLWITPRPTLPHPRVYS